MALPTLDATFASAADVPRRYMLAQWLVNISYSGSVADYVTLPEYYLWAKIAVAAGAPRGEADYISLPKNYIWKDIYDAVSGSSAGTIDWHEKQAIGHIAAAYRGDTGNPANLATYIDWPWRYQVASIVTHTNIDTDAQAFITASGATDKKGIDQFVKEVKNLGLWSSMVSWPLRSSQNTGTGTTAYSLGGLGTFNGTLVNGPTWGTNGISFASASSQHITTNDPNNILNATNKPLTVAAAAVSDSGLISSTALISKGRNAALATLSYTLRYTSSLRAELQVGNGTNQALVQMGVNTWPYGTRNWALGRYDGSTASVRIGNGADTTAAYSNPLQTVTDGLTIGCSGEASPTNFFNGAISFALVAFSTNTTQLYDLYKSTLGIGLELS